MSRCAIGLVLGLLFAGGGWAQQSAAPSPTAKRTTDANVARPTAAETASVAKAATTDAATPVDASGPDAPASKEDVERFLDLMHTRERVQQMLALMSKQTDQMMDEQLAKNQADLPSDARQRLKVTMDDLAKNIPIDEMLEAVIPIYQKHWTKGDVNNLIAFYSTPTGQKLLRDMPQTMAEGMEAMRPIFQRQMADMRARVEQEVAQLKKEHGDAHDKTKEPGGK